MGNPVKMQSAIKSICGAGLVLILSACTGSGIKTDAHPMDPNSPTVPQEISSFRVTDPEPPQVLDKELETVPPEMQPKVEQWIAYFQGKGRPHMERYLGRSTRHIQLMKRILRQNGLPEDLVYIALIESGFSSRATSRAAAVGYWQFIKGTGRRYGLEVNSFIDERRDPVLSTQAAAEYFKGLYSVFGSWYLSMASYNVGENRVKREVMAYYTRDFWELARKRRFPKETVNYIPKFIAAKMIAKNPDKYGFSDLDTEPPQEFELIKVDKALNLKTMAAQLNMDYEDFKMLNPKFKGEVAPTKGSEGLELRVPVGQSQQALAAAQKSFVDKLQYVADAGETDTYRVRPGDSLYTIAKRYHTTVANLRDSNDLKAGKKLRIGMHLQVPDIGADHHKSSTAKVAVLKPVKVKVEKSSDDNEAAGANPEVVTTQGVYYIVQPGDTLSAIADDYDSSINELRRMNKLNKSSVIRAGMKLRVPKDDGLPKALDDTPGTVAAALTPNLTDTPANSGEVVNHTVQTGESLAVIAKKYGVTILQIRQANNLKRKSKISKGTTLVIPVKLRPSGSVDRRRSQERHPAQVRVHVVRPGENLEQIAGRYQVSLRTLITKNRISDGSHILVGRKLFIPVAQASQF